jgi:hypothetical protein
MISGWVRCRFERLGPAAPERGRPGGDSGQEREAGDPRAVCAQPELRVAVHAPAGGGSRGATRRQPVAGMVLLILVVGPPP